MTIRNVVARGFGPGAAIKFVATRGFSIGAAVVTPPNASLATRGFGQHGTIARLVTRYYGIGGAITPPPTVNEPSGRYHTYSARKFYALREKIEREREELALALAAIERKKDEQKRESKQRAELAAPYVARQSDLSDLVREVAEAVQMAANLRQMEHELLEAELQDEDDLIVALLS